jgi:hypothetical protein
MNKVALDWKKYNATIIKAMEKRCNSKLAKHHASLLEQMEKGNIKDKANL